MQPSANIDYLQIPNRYLSTYLPIGKRLIVLAESTQGELYNPVPVTSMEVAKAHFGSGPLLDRFQDVMAASSSGIYLMRIESNAFQKAWDYLIKFPFDLIYTDALHFTGVDSTIQAFIDFAKEKEQQGQLIHGFFNAGTSSMSALRSLYIPIMNLSVTVENGTEELGKYMSIVSDQIKDHTSAAVYAGLILSLDPEISPVNKTLQVELKSEYSNDEQTELQGAGIVCFKQTLKRGAVCASSSCAVRTEGSAHKHISNFRIAQYLIQEVADEQDQLVGRTGYMPVLEDLKRIAESALQSYVDLKRIKHGTYEVRVDWPYMRTDIEIIPIFSVYRLSSMSQVRVRT